MNEIEIAIEHLKILEINRKFAELMGYTDLRLAQQSAEDEYYLVGKRPGSQMSDKVGMFTNTSNLTVVLQYAQNNGIPILISISEEDIIITSGSRSIHCNIYDISLRLITLILSIKEVKCET